MHSVTPPPSRAGEVLAAVHRTPGISRAAVAESLGLSSGLASDLVARLVAGHALCEGEPVPGGGRGRPTRALRPHPEGPVVLAAAVLHETWRVEACGLGGEVLAAHGAAHDGRQVATLRRVAQVLDQLWERYAVRVGGIAVTVPGTVSGTRLVQAPNLDWEDVALEALVPAAARAAGIPFHAGNDANDSARAELVRGAAEGVGQAIVLFMESGVGGALIDGGRVTAGAHGMTGEFGHLPLGARGARCRCGALGCWNTELDGPALAARLGQAPPADEVSFVRGLLDAAAAAPGPERRAVAGLARSLGRGTAGLVNACDPERVICCGLAARVLQVAGAPLHRAYAAGLMAARREDPPPVLSGRLGERAPIVGAMEAAFAPVLAGV